MNAYEGQTYSITELFLDEWDEPLIPNESYGAPVVRLMDVDKSTIAEVIAVPDASERGLWRADLPIPKMNLRDQVKLIARWTLRSDEGNHTARTAVLVNPASEGRDEDLIIICGQDTRMQMSLPFTYAPPVAEQKADVAKKQKAKPAKLGDHLSFSLYYNNKAIYENLTAEDRAVKIESMASRTLADIPAVVGQPQMYPMSMLVKHRPPARNAATTYTYKVWAITPQILLAARQLEDFINKARIANIIPELEYSQADLMECLSRGLSYFNGLAPTLTAFTGTNMQGHILDAWLTCSSMYALGAQIQAEGALAFDFGGQTVSLNVDRTPAIESALGRIEQQIENSVKPLKKLLAKAGVIGGDGSQGGQFIDGSRALGMLSVTNSPTTRMMPGTRRGGGFMRGFF